MKIVVGTPGLDGVFYYRLAIPYKALRERGHDVVFINGPSDEAVQDADVMVMSRTHSALVLDKVRAFQARGGKVVFDLDDNVWDIPSDNPASGLFGRRKKPTLVMEEYMRVADAMTVSTPALQYIGWEIRGAGNPSKRPWLCYNMLRDDEVAEHSPPITGDERITGQVRIGWAGSNTHRGDFATIVEPLSKVMHEFPNTRLVLQGADMRDLMPPNLRGRVFLSGDTWRKPPSGAKVIGTERYVPNNNSIWRGVAPASEENVASKAESRDLPTYRWYRKLVESKIDIGLAPLASNDFNLCKSWVKLLEYGMVGIPAIASAFGEYKAYGMQAAHMGIPAVRLAITGKEWEEHLRAMVMYPAARESLAAGNRKNVLQHHTVATNAILWEDALRSLFPLVPA